jgi:hypothetical protein
MNNKYAGLDETRSVFTESHNVSVMSLWCWDIGRYRKVEFTGSTIGTMDEHMVHFTLDGLPLGGALTSTYIIVTIHDQSSPFLGFERLFVFCQNSFET